MPITNIGTSPVIPYQAGTPEEGPAYFTFAIVLPANQISISQSKPFPVGMSQVLSVLVDNRTNTFDITVSFAGGSNFQVGRGQSTIVPVFAPASAKTLDVHLSVTAAQSIPSVIVFQAFNTREDLAIFGQQQATISDQTRVLGSRIINPVMFTNSRKLVLKLSSGSTLFTNVMSLTTNYQQINPGIGVNSSRVFDIVIYNPSTSYSIFVSLDAKNDAYTIGSRGMLSLNSNGYFADQYWIKAGGPVSGSVTFAVIPDFSLSGTFMFDTTNFVFGSASLVSGSGNVILSNVSPIFGDSWTIEGWLRYPPANFGSNLSVLSFNNIFTFQLNSTGKILLTFYRWGNVIELTVTSNFVFPDSNFHHFAIVSDGYTLKLFIDGSLDQAFGFPVNFGSLGTISIGPLGGKANLDELAFWQIPKYFNDFSKGQVGAPFSANMAGLAALWHFDNNLFDSGPGAFAYI